MKRNVAAGEKHFTASVWVLTRSIPKKMLLIHHAKLGKWQQPGGHIEEFENPIDAAIREVKEETGIDITNDIEKIRVIDSDGSFLPTPRFLMEHSLPQVGETPPHFHIDVNYVVEIDEERLQSNMLEGQEVRWFFKEEIENLETHGDTKIIVDELM